MTTEQVESFLYICQYRSITRAADALFISQSSLSTRLRLLEADLGFPLFVRNKGQRETVLTPQGEKFYVYAQQYRKLMGAISNLNAQTLKELRVSSIPSLGSCLLPEVWELLLKACPSLVLSTPDMELDEAAAGIIHRTLDAAFEAKSVNNSLITSTLVFEEPMVLLVSPGTELNDPVSVKTLDPGQEIYIPWCEEFRAWHSGVFGSDMKPTYTSALMEPIRYFLLKKGHWAILPVTVANSINESGCFMSCDTLEPLPKRHIYCLRYIGDEKLPLIERMLDCLYEVLDHYPMISVSRQN